MLVVVENHSGGGAYFEDVLQGYVLHGELLGFGFCGDAHGYGYDNVFRYEEWQPDVG